MLVVLLIIAACGIGAAQISLDSPATLPSDI